MTTEFPKEAWCDHTIKTNYEFGSLNSFQKRSYAVCTCGWEYISPWLSQRLWLRLDNEQ